MRRIGRIAINVVLVMTALEVFTIAVFRYVTPPTTPLMALRAVRGDGARRTWVPYKAMSRDLVLAVIASEDQRFCFHRGVDREALRHAIGTGGRVGGSTISMQATRNLLLWPHRDIVRKLVELPLTGVAEVSWHKRRILELYLNVAEMGRGVFGVEQAARRYWHIHASKLTLHQGALLATTLPNPRHADPRHPTARMRSRAAQLEQVVRRPELKRLWRCV